MGSETGFDNSGKMAVKFNLSGAAERLSTNEVETELAKGEPGDPDRRHKEQIEVFEKAARLLIASFQSKNNPTFEEIAAYKDKMWRYREGLDRSREELKRSRHRTEKLETDE